MTQHLRKYRAFTLIELIGALVLFTAFALVSTRLFGETMQVLRDAPNTQDGIARFESFTQTLRQDAWGAQTFSAIGKNVVEMRTANHDKIRWEIDSSGDVNRSEGAERRLWLGAGTNAVLQIEGPCVVLQSMRSKADGEGELRCVSLLQFENLHRAT